MPSFPGQGIDQFYMVIYGGYGYEGCGMWGGQGPLYGACAAFLGLASGLPQTGNPPYTVNDFLAMYPKFGGTSTVVAGTFTAGSQTVTSVSPLIGVQIGQLIACQELPYGTVITGVNSGTLTVSNPASVSATDSAVNVYTSMIVPLAMIQVYLNIAAASLMQSRWREIWMLATALYIAHYLTLYLQTEGNPQSTANQIVANSLQAGVTVSQGADGVSQGLKDMAKLDNWGTWTLTQYGVQLGTMARVVGAGPIYVRA